MSKHTSNARNIKHFLLGAGFALVVTFSASSVFAQSLAILSPSSTFSCLALGGKIVTQSECSAANAGTVRWCSLGETPQTGSTGGATCKALPPLDSAQQPAQSTQQGQQLPFCMGGQEPSSGTCALKQMPSQPATAPTQQATTPTPTQSDNGISDLKKMLEEMKAEQAKEKAEQEKEDLMKMLKEATQKNQQPLFGQQQFEEEEEAPILQQQQQSNKVNKPKLSSAKNPAVALAKKGLQNVDKLLNTLSKKFNKAKSKTKKIAVVRSVAKEFMKLCKKYTPSIQDEDFGDDESFTCDEFVADISESIASALKSKDVDLAFEATYDALDINFRELFESLTQQ